MKPQTEPHRTEIPLLFVLVLLWMPAQYLISARYGEPYPALVMPGFGGTLAGEDGKIHITNVTCKVLFRDGAAAWVSAYDLLAQAPSAYHNVIMSHMFGPAKPRPSPSWVALRLFPGRVLSRLREAQTEPDPQTKEWLSQRVQALFPSQTPSTVTFVWYVETFDPKQVPQVASRQPLGLREVRLSED
jgi:hypothetical protein